MNLAKPNFSFTLGSKVSLSDADLQVLTFLYQPIIGVDAFSLYHLLASYPVNKKEMHNFLLQMLNCDMDALLKARYRLEGVGLLDVYEEESDAIYLIKRPLEAKNFFADGILRAFLYLKVGSHDFNMLKNLLIDTDAKTSIKGTRVTKRFDEVFDVAALSVTPQMESGKFSPDTLKNGIEIDSVFDVVEFQKIMVNKGISQAILTPELVQILNEFTFLYKFDLHELARLLFDAMVPNGSIDIGKLKLLARTQFQLISKGAGVRVVVKSDKINKTPENIDSPEAKIESFFAQSPVDFLQFKSGGKPPVPSDLRIVEWMFIDQGLPAGVVNVLVDYVLEYTGGKLPKALVETIVGQWQRLKIDTAAKAMEQVATVLQNSSTAKKEQVQTAKTKINMKRATRSEPIPEWLGRANSKQSVVDEDVIKQRIENMKQAMYEKAKDN